MTKRKQTPAAIEAEQYFRDEAMLDMLGPSGEKEYIKRAHIIASKTLNAIDVATLVWQKWAPKDIAQHFGISLDELQFRFPQELERGAQMIEGRIIIETVQKALSGDEKTLHLLLKSKFGFQDRPEQIQNLVVQQLSPESKLVIDDVLQRLENTPPKSKK